MWPRSMNVVPSTAFMTWRFSPVGSMEGTNEGVVVDVATGSAAERQLIGTLRPNSGLKHMLCRGRWTEIRSASLPHFV